MKYDYYQLFSLCPNLSVCCDLIFMSIPHRPFTTVQAVLEGACHMVAMQISAEPLVRQAVRQVFKSRAVLSVKPTKKGRKVRKEET